ncbi:hypothetical protein TWF694_005322 [Orbilia ellipsospora]|uniref:Uncharacterized protein n=1 Tax=Orbilia ellipsospora TaxID=2528407 RepID=A0AAV9WTU7_9PEZI
MEKSSGRKAKRSRGCTSIFHSFFGPPKEVTTTTPKVTRKPAPKKLEIKTRTVVAGTGSDLKDLRFYLGNESLRICRQLCRVQDEEKHISIRSHRIGSLPFNVRQFDEEDAPHTLLLPATIFEDEADEQDQKMMKIFMDSFISMLPFGAEKISRKSNPAGLVFRLLPSPIIPSAARYLGAAFWLWLCAIDDHIEQLNQQEFEKAIKEIKMVFDYKETSASGSNVVQTSLALRDIVQQTELTSDIEENEWLWRRSFLDAIMEILYAFEGERPLLDQFQKEEKVKLSDWMVLRMVTISARPFMILARASLGLSPTLSSLGNTFKQSASKTHKRSDSIETITTSMEWEEDISKLEVLAQCAMGLENDILGWEKDHAENNILNSVEILFQNYQHRQSGMREMVMIHNYTVNQMCLLGETVLSKYSGAPEPMSPSLPPPSPARTIFGLDAMKGPLSPLPMIQNFLLPTPPVSPMDAEHSRGNILQMIKSKFHGTDQMRSDLLTKEGKYVMILFGFVQGMAVWTSKAKRYAV